jgi:beta-glucosidase
MGYPDGFVWGVATASYQIEGAAHEDGRGLSVWDMHARRPGKTFGGHTGEVACDHYHRYREDVALMRELGVQGYRLSLAWPRILPDGTGAVNPLGLGFYDRLVDELLAAGITPYVTLYHWDLPYELYCRGGWLNREIVGWFAAYTRVVVDALSDRVQHWMTLNEPQCFIGLALREGTHAPGTQLGTHEVLRAGHHALLAHGEAVRAIRAHAKAAPQVGYAPVGVCKMPASESPEDIAAARAATFSMTNPSTWNTPWWLDPVFLGHYPEDGLRIYGDAAPRVLPGDMETISQPLDFCGVNTYMGDTVRAGADGTPEAVPYPVGAPQTACRWPITPDSLYWGPRFLHERYGKPVVITENGLSNMDWVMADGKVHDPQRIDFLTGYLRAYRRAADEGIPLLGYFQWSFMDNFEWLEGYKERFGLVYVDYQTQQRIPKDSFYWYQNVIATNGASLGA